VAVAVAVAAAAPLLVLWLSRHGATSVRGWILYCGFVGRHGTGPSALRKRGRPQQPESKGFGRAPLEVDVCVVVRSVAVTGVPCV
jgi:hypothetical protein